MDKVKKEAKKISQVIDKAYKKAVKMVKKSYCIKHSLFHGQKYKSCKMEKKWKNDIEIMEAWGFNEKGEQVCVTSDDIRTLISKEKQKSFEQGWQMGHKQTKEDYQYSKQHKSALLKFKEDILTDLYIIRASIPPSFGMGARKLTKKLIDKLEDEK